MPLPYPPPHTTTDVKREARRYIIISRKMSFRNKRGSELRTKGQDQTPPTFSYSYHCCMLKQGHNQAPPIFSCRSKVNPPRDRKGGLKTTKVEAKRTSSIDHSLAYQYTIAVGVAGFVTQHPTLQNYTQRVGGNGAAGEEGV